MQRLRELLVVMGVVLCTAFVTLALFMADASMVSRASTLPAPAPVQRILDCPIQSESLRGSTASASASGASDSSAPGAAAAARSSGSSDGGAAPPTPSAGQPSSPTAPTAPRSGPRIELATTVYAPGGKGRPETAPTSGPRIELVTTVYAPGGKGRPEDVKWLRELPDSITVKIWSATPVTGPEFEFPWVGDQVPDNMEILPLANPKRAQECVGYIRYWVENYESLPEVMVMAHGMPFDHSPNLASELPRLISSVVDNKVVPQYGFIHMNTQRVESACWRPELSQNGVETVAALHLPNQFYNAVYCCAQFVVTRETVQRKSRNWWRLAEKLVREHQDCSAMEHLWHYIFTGQTTFSGHTLGSYLRTLG